jgi:hypothetical protein
MMTIRLTIPLLLSIMFSIGITGCSPVNEEIFQVPIHSITDHTSITEQARVWQQVTVNYYDFEGGFYGFVTLTGGKLLPMNLEKKYKVPGTVLNIKGDIIKDMITLQQWGQPFSISDVKLIKLGKVENPNTF